MAHVLQFLHLTSNVPNRVLIGIMVLNVVIAVVAVMFPAWRMGRENIINRLKDRLVKRKQNDNIGSYSIGRVKITFYIHVLVTESVLYVKDVYAFSVTRTGG